MLQCHLAPNIAWNWSRGDWSSRPSHSIDTARQGLVGHPECFGPAEIGNTQLYGDDLKPRSATKLLNLVMYGAPGSASGSLTNGNFCSQSNEPSKAAVSPSLTSHASVLYLLFR